jgi:hypothetical protein
VTVSSSFGSGELSGAFLHTPAVVTPPSALLGTVLDIADYGPVGSIYQVNFSPFETSIPLPPYGTLLIGPTSVFALALLVYPGPDGVGTLPLFLPEDPTLSGVTLHFQSLAVISLSPLDARLTNRSSTLLL